MKPTLYLESTIPSYLVARPSTDVVREAHRQITMEWWGQKLALFEAFVSELVIEEISHGDLEAANSRLAAIEPFHVLRVTHEAIALAEYYVQVVPLLKNAEADAIHLAIATTNKLNYLVTWNCRHIARGSVLTALPEINEKKGYKTPIICTPEELLYENEDDLVRPDRG